MSSKRILGVSLFAMLFAGLAFFYAGTDRGDNLGRDVFPRPAYAAPATIFKTYLPLILSPGVPTNPLWRFGVARARRLFTDYVPADITAMRFGWYVDFTATPSAPQPYGIQYVPTVRVKQWKVLSNNPVIWTAGGCVTCTYAVPYTYTVSPGLPQIASMAAARPGMLWLIGNEIERVDWDWNGYQDEIRPEVYAMAYHDIYNAIKSGDLTAQVAIGGMIQATPLRLKYLTLIWDGYSQTYSETMPVDVWNIHGFVLQERSCNFDPSNCYGAEIPAGLTETLGVQYSVNDNKNFSYVSNNIVALRNWMQQRGQQNKPLIVSEYGVLYPDWASPGNLTPDQVRDSFMYPSFTYFLTTGVSSALGYPADGNRLVQRWNWYSLDDDSGCYCNYSGVPYNQYFNGNLFYSGLGANALGIAPLGTYWKQYVQPLPAGSSPPYGPQRVTSSPALTVDAPIALASESAKPDCAEQQRVRLLFYEPSRGHGVIGNRKLEPAKLVRTSDICLPRVK